MRRVHVASDVVTAGWLESVLEGAGIACLVRNGYLAGALGELPPTACWPEIWVIDDGDAVRASRLLAELAAPAPPAASWCCPGCGEQVDGAFAVCWQCGAAAPP